MTDQTEIYFFSLSWIDDPHDDCSHWIMFIRKL